MMKLFVVITALLGFIDLARSAPGAVAAPIPNSHDCVMRASDELAKQTPMNGLTKEDLVRLSRHSELGKKWVQWYVGRDKSLNDELKASTSEGMKQRISKSASCDAFKKFATVLNNTIYSGGAVSVSEPIECTGGDYQYRFRVIGDAVEMELAKKSTESPEGKLLSREPVRFVGTSNTSCRVRVEQVKPDAKKLKICLPPDPAKGEARVAMAIAGRDIPDEAKQLACKASDEAILAMREKITKESQAAEQAVSNQPSTIQQPGPHRLSASPAPGLGAKVSR